MARYNKIRIGTTWLTSDGTEFGFSCKVQVTGLEKLVTDKTGKIIGSANGTPYAQLIDVSNKGNQVSVLTDFMEVDVFDAIVAQFNSAKNNGVTLGLEIQGDTGTFLHDTLPALSVTSFSNPVT